jgi:hypothetical protein
MLIVGVAMRIFTVVDSFYLSHKVASKVGGRVCVGGESLPSSLEILNVDKDYAHNGTIDSAGCVSWDYLGVNDANDAKQQLFLVCLSPC